jgi:hypothetical protein
MYPIIDNWKLITYQDLSTPVDLIESFVSGKIYNHSEFEDGSEIVTSNLFNIDIEVMIAETKNGTYVLGTPDPVWVGWAKDCGYDISELISSFKD